MLLSAEVHVMLWIFKANSLWSIVLLNLLVCYHKIALVMGEPMPQLDLVLPFRTSGSQALESGLVTTL